MQKEVLVNKSCPLSLMQQIWYSKLNVSNRWIERTHGHVDGYYTGYQSGADSNEW